MCHVVCLQGHCVAVFTEDGKFLRRLGDESLTAYPSGIDASDSGDILVGDSHGNRFHIVVLQRDGKVTTQLECPYMKVSRCCGLRVTAEGFIVTLSKNNQHVYMYNTVYVSWFNLWSKSVQFCVFWNIRSLLEIYLYEEAWFFWGDTPSEPWKYELIFLTFASVTASMFASLMWTLTRTSVYFSILAAAFQVKLGSRLPLNFSCFTFPYENHWGYVSLTYGFYMGHMPFQQCHST